MKKAQFNGITFIDINKSMNNEDWSFPDYECDRIPVKGEVMSFNHSESNTMYYGEVLLVIDSRQMLGADKMQDSEVISHSITVLLKEITGKWGEETYYTLLSHFNHKK